MGSTLKEKNLLLREQILSFKSRSHLVRTALSQEANRMTQKLFPFLKVVEIHGGVPSHPKVINP